MPQIYQLPVVSQASLGDQLAVYTPNNGDARRMSLNTLLAFFQQQFASPTLATSIYTPTTGFSIGVPSPVSQQQWMLLQPAGTLASGTVTLPLNTITPDGTEVLITTSQQITAFTLGAERRVCQSVRRPDHACGRGLFPHAVCAVAE
jgi:hypothetical protein